MSGPLTGAEEILLFCRPDNGLVVLSVDLWHQNIAVEIEYSVVVAA
jgi:hypothetical protein